METREIDPRWVRRYLHEIDSPERDRIRDALGFIPMDPDAEGVDRLFARVAAGAVNLFVIPPSGPIEAACFFELQPYPKGTNLHVNAVVALPGKVARLLDTDIPCLEEVARSLECSSMSVETCFCGVLDRLARHGWRATSVICRKVLT